MFTCMVCDCVCEEKEAAHIYTHVCLCEYAKTYVYVFISTYAYVQGMRVCPRGKRSCTHIYTYVHMKVCVNVQKCMYTYS